MTLPSSGPLSLNDIQGEFGGTNPIGMNEYYAGGGLVPAGTSGTYGAVPSSGTISIQNFYGTSNFVPVYVENVFQTWLYTGNDGLQTINNGIDLSGNGGLVWIKSRSNAVDNILVDTTRGPNSIQYSNTAGAAFSSTSFNGAFSSTGYSFNNSFSYFNTTGYTYASWTFRKQPKFFDVVAYTGDGVAGRNISHSLGSVPGCIIIKRTNSSTNWAVYHRSTGNAQSLALNLTNAASASTFWNYTTPTSTVFTVGADNEVNASGSTYVAYLFAHDAGGFGLTGTDNVISCGSYTGNGTTQAINLGYEVQFLLTKMTNNTGSESAIQQSWRVVDIMRGMPVEQDNQLLLANTNGVEQGSIDSYCYQPSSTGFVVNSQANQSGKTFIYIAIRRGPMKVPTSGTSVFSPVTYAGNAGSQTITSGFPIDLLLEENRNKNFTYGNWAVDRLRGSNVQLYTDDTTSQLSDGTYKSFASNTAMVLSGNGNLNGSGANYISWFFRRAPNFFDEVCFTGVASTNQRITHNLGVAPELIFQKSRSAAASWFVYAATSGINAYNRLNTNYAQNTSANFWGSSAPTTTDFGFNTTDAGQSGVTCVAYLFATCAGVSKVGSYTGTGALQTINCNFTTGARFVLIKRTDSTGDWYVWDSARGISSGNDPYLILNGPQPVSENTTTNYVDTTSVGFQVTAAASGTVNISGGSYIFLAIA